MRGEGDQTRAFPLLLPGSAISSQQAFGTVSAGIKAQQEPRSEISGHCYIQLFIWFQKARHVLYLDLDV